MNNHRYVWQLARAIHGCCSVQLLTFVGTWSQIPQGWSFTRRRPV
jgi:hypothetical protein